MNVKDCMNHHVIAVEPEESVAVASRLMARHNVGALPVRARDGSLCGIVTDRDVVLRCVALERSPQETTVARVMTDRVASVPPTASLSQAAAILSREQVRRLPVVEGRRIVGMVSLGDLARSRSFDMEASKALSEISDPVKKLEGT